MATQGIVSVVKHGSVVLKCIAGCDGYRAGEVAAWIHKHTPADEQQVYNACLDIGFGCKQDLVVMGPDCVVFEGELFRASGDGELDPLYRKTFGDPRFNPRWECGLAPYVEIAELEAADGT